MSDNCTNDSDREWPPTFDVQLNERQQAIMNCYELMERLTEEYGGTGQIRKVQGGRISVELHFDVPESNDSENTEINQNEEEIPTFSMMKDQQ